MKQSGKKEKEVFGLAHAASCSGRVFMFMPLRAVEFIASVPLHAAGVVLCNFIQRSSAP